MPDYQEKGRERLSRQAEFVKFQVEYDPPPEPDAGGYLLQLFFRSGMAESSGYGEAPLSWREIESFDSANALCMTAWEKRVLRRLSEVYASGLSRYRNPKAPPPYVSEENPLAKRQRDAINHAQEG